MNKINKLKKFIKNNSGIGLVETIVALGISIMILTAIVSLTIFTLRVSTTSKLLQLGSKYATEEVERARALRDSSASWGAYMNSLCGVSTGSCTACTTSTSRCHITNTLGVNKTARETLSTGGSESMSRHYWVTAPSGGVANVGDGIVRINVEVSWTAGGQAKSTYIYTDLSDWRN